MTERQTAAIVLAAGMGTRMKSQVPKVLHPIAGRPMILCLLDSLAALGPDRLVVVVGPGMDAVAEAVAPVGIAVQDEPRGTAHAVLAARQALAGFEGDVLVLFGGDPLITPETVATLVGARRAAPEPAIVVLGMRPDDPAAYGRLILAADGGLERIVEFRDASPEERAVDLCNSGVMAIDGRVLFDLLDRIGCDNAKNEYYLTDIVGLARAEGLRCAIVEGDARELQGVDSRADLAAAEALMQARLRHAAMDGGATLSDPESVHFSYDTVLGRDVSVEPNVFFGPGVRVGDGVHIRAFSHLEGATIAPGAVVGPFARLRPGADIGEGARIGNFVEVKQATIEQDAKVNHLSYVGDARVGVAANIGAGTITCNYDGFTKSHTDIGAGAFIGSNTALVAPVAVGKGAVIGAGSVITRDVPDDALGLTRAPQKAHAGAAARLRARKQAAKTRRDR
ncbi:MAG: bifunctional UDP-N-acetylglucosamine diphosphorylase/glucosamine-1-phosphate N-acetyltransferase GlmU [Alphaproteobacteria bacterium]